MKTTARDVLLFVPNLIGYVRIILALVAFYVIKTDYVMASSCYLLSGLLDAFDGHAARLLNQICIIRVGEIVIAARWCRACIIAARFGVTIAPVCGILIEMFDVGLARLVLYISAPIMIVKAAISLIHLIDASTRLAAIDAEERSKAK